MKLYRSELQKLCASRLLIGLFVGALMLNAILAAIASRPSPAETAAREAYEGYLADPAASDAYYADLCCLAAENFRDESYTLPHTYTEDADDLLVLSRMYERVDYLAGHDARMTGVLRAAENRIADLQYYGYTKASYVIRHQRQLIARYEGLRGTVSPTSPFAFGYEAFLAYPVSAILTGMFITVAVAYICLNDRACGFGSILRTTCGGHRKTALAKLGATVTVSLAATLLLSLSAFLAVGMTVGYSSPTAAVQTLPRCATVPFALTVGEYLALRLGFVMLAMLTYAGLLAVVASLRGSYVGSVCVGALFWGGNYALFSHRGLGTPPAVRYLNVLSLVEGNTLTDSYRSVSVFGYPVSHPTVLCLATVLLSFILYALASLIHGKDRRGVSAVRRNLRWHFPARKQAKTHRTRCVHRVSRSLGGYELKKLRFGWLGLTILLLLGVKGIYTYSVAGNMERYDEALYYDYITAIQPMTPTARAHFMTDERARIDAILADEPMQTDAYERGEKSSEEYAAYLDTYYTARAQDGVFRRVESYIATIDAHDRLTGRESDVLYTTGAEVFFGFSSDRLVYFAILLLTVGVFAVEYRKTSSTGDAASLIRATPRGRGHTFAVKLGICAASGALLTVIFRAVGLWVVANGYILPAMNAAVSSIPGFDTLRTDRTVGQYLLLDFAVQALAGTLLGALIGALSCLFRHPLPILSSTLLLTAVPELLTATLFPHAPGMSLLSLTVPQSLLWQSSKKRFLSLEGAWMAFVCLALILFVTVLVLLAYRAYNPRPRKGATS